MPKSTFVKFMLDVIRKLTSGKFKVQTYYAISDLLVNELRKSRASYSDFYQKLEVFLQSADMSSTAIVNCTKTY